MSVCTPSGPNQLSPPRPTFRSLYLPHLADPAHAPGIPMHLIPRRICLAKDEGQGQRRGHGWRVMWPKPMELHVHLTCPPTLKCVFAPPFPSHSLAGRGLLLVGAVGATGGGRLQAQIRPGEQDKQGQPVVRVWAKSAQSPRPTFRSPYLPHPADPAHDLGIPMLLISRRIRHAKDVQGQRRGRGLRCV